MDALKIALETILVGALALPWLALVIRFFFPDANTWLQHLPALNGDQVRSTVVAVLVAASGYCLGAAVARLGQDFFDDDDLPILATEDHIRVSVYCDELQSGLVQAAVPFQENSQHYSSITPDWFIGVCQADGSTARDRVRQIFQIQESTLLLAGTDKTSRLSLLHQQIMVLRGAAFNGVLTCVLFVLGWNLQRRSWGKARYVLPLAIILGASVVLHSHFAHQHIQPFRHPSQIFSVHLDDPPFMEFTFLLLGVAGCYLVWKGIEGSWKFGTGFLAALFPTAMVYAGWYWTEILYNRLVLYSYFAQTQGLLKPGP